MKKKGLIALMAAAAIVTAGCGLYDSDGYLKKNVTVEQLKGIESEHGQLLQAEYSHGGGMLGESYQTRICTNEEGQLVFITQESSEHSLPLRVREYPAAQDALEKLTAYIDEYNLEAWDALPFDDQHIALDAPSTHIRFSFRDMEDDRFTDSVDISYDDVIPDGGYDILNGFVELLGQQKTSAEYTSTYLLNFDGEKVFSGRDIQNTEEEIGLLIQGSWISGSEIMDGQVKTLGYESEYIYRFGMYFTSGMEVEFGKVDMESYEHEEYGYGNGEIVYEPYGDADCSWHIKAVSGDGERTLYCAIDGDRMIIDEVSGSGGLIHRLIMIRE